MAVATNLDLFCEIWIDILSKVHGMNILMQLKQSVLVWNVPHSTRDDAEEGFACNSRFDQPIE